jgi:hypothetical protein
MISFQQAVFPLIVLSFIIVAGYSLRRAITYTQEYRISMPASINYSDIIQNLS